MFQRTLVVTPFYAPNIGGAETFAEDLAKALAKNYVVHICTIRWKKPVLWEGTDCRKAISIAIRIAWSLILMTRKYVYTKIYALGFISCFVCAVLNIPFYAVVLSIYDFKKKNRIISWVLNKAIRVYIEKSKEAVEDLTKAGVNEAKIIGFVEWCDQSRFYPKNRPTDKALKVLFIGRSIKIKGKHIIEACEKLTKGVHYEYVEAVPYDSLPSYYQMADVVVIPSLYRENFSRVVVEAASCGCVVITSNLGALPEAVKDFGFSIEPTPQKFRELIERLDRDRQLLKILQDKSVIHSLRYFSKRNTEVF